MTTIEATVTSPTLKGNPLTAVRTFDRLLIYSEEYLTCSYSGHLTVFIVLFVTKLILPFADVLPTDCLALSGRGWHNLV